MPIRNSFSILLCNFKLVYKLLFFMLVIVLIGVAVCFSLLNPVIEGYLEEVREDLDIDFDQMVRHPIKTLERFLEIFIDYININIDIVNAKLIYLGLILFVIRFFTVLPVLPVSNIIYSKMTTNFDQGLFNSFISTLPQNLLFSLISSLLIGAVDLGLTIGLAIMTVALIKVLGIIALPLSLAIIIAVFSLRMTLVCQWLPEIAHNNGRKIFSAFKASLKPMAQNFSKNLICITVVNIVSVSLILVTLIPTVGLVPIFLIPTFMVLYGSLYMALNFSYRHQKYFTDNGVTIYDPTKKF